MSASVTSPYGVRPSKVAALTVRLRSRTGPRSTGLKTDGLTARTVTCSTSGPVVVSFCSAPRPGGPRASYPASRPGRLAAARLRRRARTGVGPRRRLRRRRRRTTRDDDADDGTQVVAIAGADRRPDRAGRAAARQHGRRLDVRAVDRRRQHRAGLPRRPRGPHRAARGAGQGRHRVQLRRHPQRSRAPCRRMPTRPPSPRSSTRSRRSLAACTTVTGPDGDGNEWNLTLTTSDEATYDDVDDQYSVSGSGTLTTPDGTELRDLPRADRGAARTQRGVDQHLRLRVAHDRARRLGGDRRRPVRRRGRGRGARGDDRARARACS